MSGNGGISMPVMIAHRPLLRGKSSIAADPGERQPAARD
jgi:hypothetical protein